jgi:outer membrane protease
VNAHLKAKAMPKPPLAVIFLFSLFICTQTLPAQEQSEQELTVAGKGAFQLSLGASLGLLSGQGEEIVYKGATTDNPLSQLLWYLDPLGLAGVDISLNWQKQGNRWGFFTDAHFKFGFPGGSGVMQDRDWTDTAYPAYLTHYSVSSNKTERAMLIDAAVGASFRLTDFMVIKAYLAYDYIWFSWIASGASLLYPDGQGGHKYMPDGDIVSYQQTWHIISPALALNGKLNRYFDIECSVKISPFLWCATEDRHLLYEPVMITVMNMSLGGFFIEPKMVFSWTPRDFISLIFSVAYKNVRTRGDALQNKDSNPVLSKNSGGGSYQAFDVALGAKFRVD